MKQDRCERQGIDVLKQRTRGAGVPETKVRERVTSSPSSQDPNVGIQETILVCPSAIIRKPTAISVEYVQQQITRNQILLYFKSKSNINRNPEIRRSKSLSATGELHSQIGI